MCVFNAQWKDHGGVWSVASRPGPTTLLSCALQAVDWKDRLLSCPPLSRHIHARLNASTFPLCCPSTKAQLTPSDFIRTIAPRIAYANPHLPFIVERQPDPRAKHKNPNNPDANAQPWTDGQPGPTVVIAFREYRVFCS